MADQTRAKSIVCDDARIKADLIDAMGMTPARDWPEEDDANYKNAKALSE